MRDSNDIVTVLGVIGTDPESKTTPSGVPLIKFRLASTARKFDKATNSWIDGNTNWYTVTAFRKLAINATASLRRGDPVVVTGRLRLREWNTGEKQGISIDLEADVIGLDLQWGTARYQRTIRSAPINEDTAAAGVSGGISEHIEADRFDDAPPHDAPAQNDAWNTPGVTPDEDSDSTSSFGSTAAVLEATPF